MARPKEEFEAWVTGEHQMPPEAHAVLPDRVKYNTVVVHNVTRNTWTTMTLAAFNSQFEWA